MIKVILNGADREVPSQLKINQLLSHLGFEKQPLLVEHNGLALLKSEWTTAIVSENDKIELIRVVAGG
jgi:thiamine biosynthesis protein ThiS